MTENHVTSPLRPSDPQQLGDYRIIGRLGRGGMGIVYLAESASGERAAVKVISPELADDETFRDRFRREVESARKVRRFCTAPVLDAQLDGEPLFIVTEFVDGADLQEFVTASGPMRGSSLEHLAVGVATALTAIHGAGVVHRDLKPANVLLSSVGPRVIDFGIARALDTVSGATRTGQFIGTPAYMAPELISGAKASPASDVFAWACVVAFAGTGRAPFDGPTVPSVLYQITHGEPSLDGLDEGLRSLVARALSKDPAARPSAQELLDVLTGRPHAEAAAAAETLGRTWAHTVPDGPQ
ncbi:serine/threonine-protein kinase, partial [Actinoallomurus acaciae]